MATATKRLRREERTKDVVNPVLERARMKRLAVAIDTC